MEDAKAVTPKTDSEVLEDVRKLVVGARTILESGPISGRASRIWIGDADQKLQKALDAISEQRKA